MRISNASIAEFCRKHHIRRFALFGSVLRDDFRFDSDVDILVEFENDHIPGFIRLADMELKLSHLFEGRKVDLNTPECLSPYFKDQVLKEAKVIYEKKI